jgi:hypothetical protein
MGFDQVEMPEDFVLRTDVDKFGWEGHTAKVPVLVLTTIFFFIWTLSAEFQVLFATLYWTLSRNENVYGSIFFIRGFQNFSRMTLVMVIS